MCFRPAEADAGVHPVACASCGSTVFPVEGILPSKCPFCQEPLAAAAAAEAPKPAAPSAPPTPSAPAVPGARPQGGHAASGAPGVPSGSDNR